MVTPIYPMVQMPALMEKIWGGSRLAHFGKSLPAGSAVGESWELADHPHGRSHVANGPLAGLSLRQLVESYAEALFGSRAPQAWLRRFPLLVKIIDASQDLSVQVHPDDAYTAAHGLDDTGKTECWFILDAEPGAELVVDVHPGTARADFERAAVEGRLEPCLVRQRVSAGDFLFIPAGRLHAIGAGIVLAEFQQPSDTTFRVYDWGRSAQGRPLHLRQALECINFSGRHDSGGGRGTISGTSSASLVSLADNSMFYLERLQLRGGQFHRQLRRGFEAALIVAGRARFAVELSGYPPVEAAAGTTVLLPAAADQYRLEADAPATILFSGVPRN